MAWRRVIAGVLLALAAACASPPGPARLAGSVTYRERMALPEGAVVHVTLLDVSMIDMPPRVIAEREVRGAGQVPIPFVLDFAPDQIAREHRYALRATIADAAGRLLWTTAAAQPVLGEDAPESVEVVVQRVATTGAPPGPRLFAWDCEGLSFRVEVTKERALLFLPGRSVTLPRVPSASGATYSDGSTTFWSEGAEASLTADGVEHTRCRKRPRPVP